MPDQANAPAVTGQPRLHLLIEGGATFAVCTLLYARTETSWWLYAALILAPDIAMAGYLAGARIGALLYNAAHNIAGPVLLALAGLYLGITWGIPVALIWAAHIGIDRLVGYGFKYDAGFGFTHLGQMGKAPAAT